MLGPEHVLQHGWMGFKLSAAATITSCLEQVHGLHVAFWVRGLVLPVASRDGWG